MDITIRHAARLAAQVVSTVVISAGFYALLRTMDFAEDKMRKAENKKKRR